MTCSPVHCSHARVLGENAELVRLTSIKGFVNRGTTHRSTDGQGRTLHTKASFLALVSMQCLDS